MRLNKDRKVLVGKLILIFSILVFWAYTTLNFEVMFNNDRVTLWVHGPSVVEEGEEFEITIETWDKFERLAGGYVGKISFDIKSYNSSTLEEISAVCSLPDDYEFTSNFIWRGLIPAYKITGADNGKKTLEVEINTPGIHYILVEEDDNENRYWSNPIIVKPKGSNYKNLYWGDIHGHSLYSDGSGLPTEAYQFARDVALLDFSALTDHSEYFLRMGDIDIFNVFQNYIQITNDFNEPGKFATIVAMEWTPNFIVQGKSLARGHLNFYFKGDDMPYFSTFTHLTPDDLYDYIKENSDDDFISWGHHTNIGQFGSDFGFYDEDINRLIEICSVHGSCETHGDDNLYHPANEIQDDGFSVRDALKMGRRFGIMASSDTHDGRLGHSIVHTKASAYNQYPYTLAGYRLYHKYPGSITGVFTSKLDRKHVFDALYSRSCMASTWINRHYIDFTINGLSVGVNDSIVVVPDANSNRSINIIACSDGVSMDPGNPTKIDNIKIYKNSELWKTYKDINKHVFPITINDTETITGTEYDGCIKRDGKWYIHEQSMEPVDPDELKTDMDYYYIRMVDTSGGAAWIGPIWVDVKS